MLGVVPNSRDAKYLKSKQTWCPSFEALQFVGHRLHLLSIEKTYNEFYHESIVLVLKKFLS